MGLESGVLGSNRSRLGKAGRQAEKDFQIWVG